MAIHYALYPNHLTADPGDFLAQVQSTGTVNLNDLADRVIERGSELKTHQILGLVAELVEVVRLALDDGKNVQIGDLVTLEVKLGGVFQGQDAGFSRAAGHELYVAANVGDPLLKAFRDGAEVQKEATVIPGPEPVSFVDTGSETTNLQITPGNIGEILGTNLKVNEDAEDEGVYFIAVSGGAEVKLPKPSYNKPGRLMFLIPYLPGGDYHVEIRARLPGVKQLRTGRLNQLLTVQVV